MVFFEQTKKSCQRWCFSLVSNVVEFASRMPSLTLFANQVFNYLPGGEQECSPYMGSVSVNSNVNFNSGGQECPPYIERLFRPAKSNSRFVTAFRNDNS